MSTTSGGPNNITNGLVLHLDAANEKSFRGVPTTNLVQPWATSSALPIANYGYEYNTSLVDPPILGTKFDNVKWIKFTKNSATNGRVTFLSIGSLTTGTTYMWSTHIYTNDSRVTSLTMGSDNSSNSINIVGSSYNAANSGSLQRISCSFQSLNGTQTHGLRGGATDPIGSFFYMVGTQVELGTQATPVVFGSRGATVATGGGLADRTVNQNHGELVNSPTFSYTNGGNIVLDGTNEYIVTSNFYDLAITNQITATIWCKSNTATWNDYGFLISKRDQFIIHPTISSKEVVVYVNTTTGGWQSIFFTPSVEITTFNSYTLHYTSGILKIYFNGVLITTNNSVGATLSSSTSQLYIGRDSTLSRYFNGAVSSVYVYNRALSDAEVLNNYNAQKSRFGLQ